MSFLDLAVPYLEVWDVPVFPCEPRGKRPLGALVPHGLKQATTDLATIEKWDKAAPDANLGVLTGSAFDVLDIDAAGWSSIARLVGHNGCMTLGPVVMTPGGGVHDYFLPTGLGNRVGFIPGCDWRGAAGYAIGAGSTGANGAEYEWAIGPSDDDFPLCEAPAWLLEVLTKRPQATATPVREMNASAYVRRALEGEVGKVALAAQGTRNHALNQAAFALGQLIGAGVLDPSEAAEALLIAAARCGLEETEARRTIASGFRSGAAQPRKVAL